MLSASLPPYTLWDQPGGIWPLGVPTSLSWYDLGALLHLINHTNPGLVIEIGVQYGGLAALLSAYARYTGIGYRGIEIDPETIHRTVWDQAGGAIVAGDAFAAAVVDTVRGWVAESPAPVLVFCDGSDKPRELRTYAPLLRDGDLLVAHDYGREYDDVAIWGFSPGMQQIRTTWLDETWLCVFRREGPC